MDFFKSVFSEDPSPTSSYHNSDVTPTSPSNSNSNSNSPQSPNPDDKPKFPSIGNSWTTFGSSLLKTVATKSESVIGNYRLDLEEFSSGFRKETAIIREAASRAVKDLPGRLEAGAAVAQTSLESVGQAIDNIGGAVSEIIVHGKDSIFNSSDVDSDVEFETGNSNSNNDKQNLKPYNRLEAVIRTVQCDIRTYCEQPEEAGEYLEWKKEFVLEDLVGEIEDLVKENGVIGEIYNEVVPEKVDRETFWTRYFYRVHRVKKAEEARLKLVKKAIEGEEEEELSWDVDDDEEEDESDVKAKESKEKGFDESEKKVEHLRLDPEDKPSTSKARSEAGDEKLEVTEGRSEENDLSGEKLDSKLDDRGSNSEGRNDNVSDFSVVSSQPSEVDIGWDEIEDIGSGDEAKLPAQHGPDTVDLRRQSVAADEEEDFPWDIEDDDDERAKS